MSMQDQVYAALLPEIGSVVLEFWDCDYAEKCQSEIERGFAAALLLGYQVRAAYQIGSRRENAADQKVHFFLEPQYVLGDYRVDFLFGRTADSDDLLKCIAIECDGHEWHDKTKDQAARDKARDRFLSSKVGRVLRFTGSEIYRNPMVCAEEAMKVLLITSFGYDPLGGA